MKNFGKYFIVMASILSAYLLWVAGYDTGRHHYAQMIYDLILAAFWAMVVVTVAIGERQNRQLDAELSDLHARLMAEIEAMATDMAHGVVDDPAANKIPVRHVRDIGIKINVKTGKTASKDKQ